MRPSFNRPSARRIVLSLAIVSMGLALPGCTRIRTHQGYLVDKLLVDSIQPGIDNRTSVEGTLGRPTFASQFGEQQWYYVSRDTKQLAFSNPKASDQTIIRVRFDPAGNVVGVDRAGMEKIANISPEGDKTPTLGRKRSFFEDVFGNIGAVGAGGAGGGGGNPDNTGPNGS
ncbi:outer membrane protein assembly factor BamE [Sphingobium subterraneum]|uniref:Outer membrane protein assembly factor BamE (Lipoprotein component of BamABCDE complex) n=1 Tax=Sphingobium subterraneum TaxID=627688 RepID=A0A841J9K6_9SPHN|nr:outer membrane protein assembly factor BamE [Sphingobium subterraneum]MBB6125185.1 outer membrane protein assembly factor BamE (lipoprotein component of BamABCDE complex) [Sphingobium subterraneum]